MWIINKNVSGAAIWFGQIIINVFMQFVYAFLFLIYMDFTSVSDGWAVSLLWAMMILPLGEALLNTMQNLVSRVAGLNNEEIANRGIGMGAVMAHTVHSIGAQFKSNDNSRNSLNNKNIKRDYGRETKSTNKSKVSLYGIGRNFLNAGMYLAEGRNFKNNNANIERRNYGQRLRKSEKAVEVSESRKSERNG